MNNTQIAKKILLACAAVAVFPTLMLAQAGSLDPTFGTGGIVTTPNTTTACGAVVNCAIALQSDGRIVVAGGATQSNGAPEMAMARYNTNGSLDTTFGNGGLVLFAENGGGPAFGVAIQVDGKIVTAAPVGLGLDVFRFNTNGTLDGTFGAGGIVATGAAGRLIGATPGGLALLSNGDILVAVGVSMLRLLPNGQFDSAFGTGGVAPLLTSAEGLSSLSTGKSLVTSALTFSSGSATRFNPNGSLDAVFGVVGQTPTVGEPLAIAALATGKFIIAGTLDSGVPSLGRTTPQGFVLTRYNANGTIDASFGIHGSVVTTFPGNSYAAALALAVQSNGDIVAAGGTALNNPVLGQEPVDFALVRYTPNGQLDTSFGNNGRVKTGLGNNGANTASISALAIQADGNIVAVGSNVPPNFTDPKPGFTLARYLGN